MLGWAAASALRAVAIAWALHAQIDAVSPRIRRLGAAVLSVLCCWFLVQVVATLSPQADAIVDLRFLGVCLACMPVALGLVLYGALRLSFVPPPARRLRA